MRASSKKSFLALLLWTLFNTPLAAKYDVNIITDKLESPWSMEVIGDHRFLISERGGAMRLLIDDDLSQPVKHLPEVYFKGQGGLLDIALHPEFAATNEIFFSYSAGHDEANTLVVSRARLNIADYQLEEVRDIFRVSPQRDTPVHYGGRITVLADNTLLLTSGDGFDYRESAQRMDSLMGKVLRFNFDGSPAKNNPFPVGTSQQFIWTLGHRNPQALLFDKDSNQVIVHEHGPAGGDEINVLEPGKNYGWPVITNGKDYSGANISPFKEYQGMEQPWFDWTPSVAPSDMILYRGEKFPEFNGRLLVTTLKTGELLVISRENEQARQTDALLSSLKERFRGIQQDDSGNIYLLTDSGKLLQLINSL